MYIEAICMDYVIIFGQRINRPAWCARSLWLAYWERQ